MKKNRKKHIKKTEGTENTEKTEKLEKPENAEKANLSIADLGVNNSYSGKASLENNLSGHIDYLNQFSLEIDFPKETEKSIREITEYLNESSKNNNPKKKSRFTIATSYKEEINKLSKEYLTIKDNEKDNGRKTLILLKFIVFWNLATFKTLKTAYDNGLQGFVESHGDLYKALLKIKRESELFKKYEALLHDFHGSPKYLVLNYKETNIMQVSFSRESFSSGHIALFRDAISCFLLGEGDYLKKGKSLDANDINTFLVLLENYLNPRVVNHTFFFKFKKTFFPELRDKKIEALQKSKILDCCKYSCLLSSHGDEDIKFLFPYFLLISTLDLLNEVVLINLEGKRAVASGDLFRYLKNFIMPLMEQLEFDMLGCFEDIQPQQKLTHQHSESYGYQ